MERILTVAGSPHCHTSRTTRGAMWRVVLALVPALAFGFWIFGIDALLVTVVTAASCLVTEFVITRYMLRRSFSPGGGAWLVTGLLLAMSLPSGLPLWICVIGGVVAIGLGKMAFGGLGCNIFNPALVGRVFLLISFPAQMTTWPMPEADGATGATLLGRMKLGEAVDASVDIMQAGLGFMGGSLGEVSALALILGFVYLLVTKVVTCRIPLAIFATVVVLALCCGFSVGVELLSGGLMLGALFMATDYVTSPMSKSGMVVFGIGIGVITFVIRHWGAYPEGISFAILIMNGLVPLIDRACRPRMFGERRVEI